MSLAAGAHLHYSSYPPHHYPCPPGLVTALSLSDCKIHLKMIQNCIAAGSAFHYYPHGRSSRSGHQKLRQEGEHSLHEVVLWA